MAHTADSAMGTCSAINGERKPGGAAAKTAKADLVAALRAGLEECDKAYSSLTDAKATEMIEGRGGSAHGSVPCTATRFTWSMNTRKWPFTCD